MKKLLIHLLSFRDQSTEYNGWPHYGPLKVQRTVGTKPPTYDHWAHAMQLPIIHSTAAR